MTTGGLNHMKKKTGEYDGDKKTDGNRMGGNCTGKTHNFTNIIHDEH